MGDFLEQMMRFSLNVMVSGSENIAKAMQEFQQKSETPDEVEDTFETDEDFTSTFSSMSRLSIVPLFEMSKLPITVLVKTISEAAQEIQEQDVGRYEGFSEEETAEDFDREIIPLNKREAALETEATLTEEAGESYHKTLWQIGRSGRPDFKGKWTKAFDYHYGTDIDEINSPSVPHFITAQGGPKSIGATERFNVHFTLDRDYTNGQLAFIYDRWGTEKDQVFVDDELLAPIGGAGKGMFKHVVLSLKDIPNGDHVITITTSGETEAGGHRIDYLKLCVRRFERRKKSRNPKSAAKENERAAKENGRAAKENESVEFSG